MMTQRGAVPEGGRDEAEGDVEVDEDEVSALQERRIEDPLYCLNMKNRMHRISVSPVNSLHWVSTTMTMMMMRKRPDPRTRRRKL